MNDNDQSPTAIRRLEKSPKNGKVIAAELQSAGWSRRDRMTWVDVRGPVTSAVSYESPPRRTSPSFVYSVLWTPVLAAASWPYAWPSAELDVVDDPHAPDWAWEAEAPDFVAFAIRDVVTPLAEALSDPAVLESWFMTHSRWPIGAWPTNRNSEKLLLRYAFVGASLGWGEPSDLTIAQDRLLDAERMNQHPATAEQLQEMLGLLRL